MSFEGNTAHRAPEIQNVLSLRRLFPSDARYDFVDFSKQGSFELGCLAYYIATHEDALPDYPLVYGASGYLNYDVHAVVNWSLLPASYPAGVKRMLAGLLACDPAARWSISAAIAAFRDVAITVGMVCSLG